MDSGSVTLSVKQDRNYDGELEWRPLAQPQPLVSVLDFFW